MGFGEKIGGGASRIRGKAVSVRVVLHRDAMRMEIRFTSSLAEDIKNTRVDVQEGNAKDSGKVLLTFHLSGAFSVCRSKVKSRCWVVVPALSCVPEGWVFTSKPCAYEWLEAGSKMLLTLPVEEWKKEVDAVD